MKLKEKPKKKKNKKGQYPPKKERKRKIRKEKIEIKNTENMELVDLSKTNRKIKKKQAFERSSIKSGKDLLNKEFVIKDISPNDFKSEIIKDNNIISNSDRRENKEEIKEKKQLDMFELNNLEYVEACELDTRGFCSTYWSVLMREHIILFTFFNCYDYNLFYIKIERFFILICTQMTINGLFFIHESMHRKYVTGEDFTFVQKLPQLLFTLIGAHIIEVILCYLSMTDTQIYQIKALPKEEKSGEEIINIMDQIKRRLVGFFIFTFLLFLFYWYFISAFCAVYQNTQIIFLRDSSISILTSFLDPFIIYGITTFLRLISLSSCYKKKLGCIYKLSDLIPIF